MCSELMVAFSKVDFEKDESVKPLIKVEEADRVYSTGWAL
jgi:hypothetical protein